MMRNLIETVRRLDELRDIQPAPTGGQPLIYVWRGSMVLKNYSSGMVIVSAHSLDEAFERIKAADIDVYFLLMTGNRAPFRFDGSPDPELSEIDPSDIETGFPLQPEVFAVDQLPVLFVHGGE